MSGPLLTYQELRNLDQELTNIDTSYNKASSRTKISRKVSGINDRYTSPTGIYFALAGLCLTTIISTLVLASCLTKWTSSGSLYTIVVTNRASMQIAIQLVANILGAVYVTSICTLVAFAVRVRLGKHAIRLDTLRFWHAVCTRRMEWNQGTHVIVLLILFIAVTALPPAIWAGALTPVTTTAVQAGNIGLPAYTRTSLIKEWGAGVAIKSPIVRNNKGVFTYNVATFLQGSLLASASSATPVDGSVRKHSKLDYTQYTYYGRSYGVGSTVGLLPQDDWLSSNPLFLEYAYQEHGFETTVKCIYNQTADFHIEADDGDSSGGFMWAVRGMMPNSGVAGEYSVYVGHDSSAIVGIGVASPIDVNDSRRILGIAAGSAYEHLNRTQCALEFVPTLFNVTINLQGRNISVSPQEVVQDVAADPLATVSANLTYTVTRLLELIANDQTNIYSSLVGNSLNDSISGYLISQNGAPQDNSSLTASTLPGLENAFTAMVDDMLVAYASAQAIVSEDTLGTPCVLTVAALRIGQDVYIYAIFIINIVTVLLVAVEAVRTSRWKRLVEFDFLDVGAVVIAAAGGEDFVESLNRREDKIRVTLTPEAALKIVV